MQYSALQDKIRDLAIASAVVLMAWPSLSFAQETAVESLVKRGLGMALWIATGVCGTMGIIVFCNGVMKMWDADDPRSTKQGKRMMFWGVFLTVAVLFAVAMREYLTAGISFSAGDLYGD